MTIRHFNSGPELRKARRVMAKFMTKVKQRMEKKIAKDRKYINWFDTSEEGLLDRRRELVKSIKEGMLERKDLEIDIAVNACFVWFNRLEVEQREQILREWG